MKPRAALLLLLAILLASAPALADSLPPNYGYCEGKKIDDPCTSDDHVLGQCKETPWSGAGPILQPGEKHAPPKMILVCEPKPPLFDKAPVDTLMFSFGVSFVMVGTGLFLVLRRRKRSAS